MSYTQYQPAPRRLQHQEMRQKQSLRDTFFGLKTESQVRPTSVATEFVDTDWDDEDAHSDFEDNSPRASINSSGQPSITTLSSYDEVPTPRSSQGRVLFDPESPKAVEGPRGPHLFGLSRSSTANSFEEEHILTLSPVTPKYASAAVNDVMFRQSVRPPMPSRHQTPFQFTHENLESSPLVRWSPEMVAQSMLNAGVEFSVAEKFVENDINGAILMTLKFEDLKELGIQSFGIRTKIWNQVQATRDMVPSSPRAPTPIEDTPSREARKERRKDDCGGGGLSRRQSSRRRLRTPAHEDIITPGESVSIVGIEQVIPKPHHCAKGENCSRYRKQRRLIEAFKKENPYVDMETTHGTVLIAGDPGNAATARALDPVEVFRPVSEAVPSVVGESVVASSDVMGTGGIPALQYLQEAALRAVQMRDPQDNVKQFLDFQHQHLASESSEVPPTPPFEIYPSGQTPHEGLRSLPKLAIPGKQTQRAPSALRTSTLPPADPQSAVQQAQPGFVPYRMDRADPLSMDLQTPTNLYRFGTPFSEMDVPVTAVPLGPIARDTSQSVPPDMGYRAANNNSAPPLRSQSRASARRPSFPVLPALDENMATPIVRSSKAPSPRSAVRSQMPLQAPPRVNYPWSPIERKSFETAIPPAHLSTSALPVKELAASAAAAASIEQQPAAKNGATYEGPMRKRKTRMLRHEWNDGYFTLKGTRLAMHKDQQQVDRTLEYIDIDDYAIACSSLASSSKLSAAFKAVNIHHSREKSDPVAAFAFQLVPQDKSVGAVTARLRKRESLLPSGAAVPAEGLNGTGKTHHFAVKSRDQRIDWMRELMLAKALKQRGEGFEVSVNGNVI